MYDKTKVTVRSHSSADHGGTVTKEGAWEMEFGKKMVLPGDIGEKNGVILSYLIHPNLELWYIDIRSRRLPKMSLETAVNKEIPFMTINYSFKGKCELLLKNGEATYLDTGEYAIDYGKACTDQEAFYYPRAEYYGLELFFYPGEELDQALSFPWSEQQITTQMGRHHEKRKEPFIARAGSQIQHACESIAEDIENGPDQALLALDVSRLLYILCHEKEESEEPRTYYSGSQVQIVRKAMDILTEDLSKRYSAAELARQFGISETSLKNYFRGVYGRGYSELLNEIRMKQAAEMIREGNSKIAQISDAVGFATQSRFARAFKNYFGISPMEYKRMEILQKEQER